MDSLKNMGPIVIYSRANVERGDADRPFPFI